MTVLANEDIDEEKGSKETFNFYSNIIHWSSAKCKRVTRSVLASELYAMVHGFDIGIAIKTTLDKILRAAVTALTLSRQGPASHPMACPINSLH